jgi:tetratricopeptide (TPR) repeat protein
MLRRLVRYEEALASSERALRCGADHAEAHSARGAVLASVGRFDEALADYRRAIELKPTLAEGLWNKAIAHLSRGEFSEGWRLYEARWKVKSLKLTQHYASRPAWRGDESVQGKVVLLHAEQGYGDAIQFCRYAPLVAARGARVILGVPSALKALMTSLDGVEDVVAQGAPPKFDHHCPLLSLPLVFGTELDSIPAPKTYLRAHSSARARWTARLGPRAAPRVGFAWSGRATHTNDLNRSITLEALLPLTRCGLEFVSLQKEIRAVDAPVLTLTPTIRRLGEELTDFADAAALVSELDLVISVDTSIAHLAGALGKPVWILLPFVADWRWLQEREDSPWYPSARLFRQSVARDWTDVIERVASELTALTGGNQASSYLAK